VFQNPAGVKKLPNRTDYLFITGPETALQGARSVGFEKVQDGASNTAYMIDMKDTGVVWSEPREIDIDQLGEGLPEGNHRGGYLVGFYDGSARFIPKEAVTPAIARALATCHGDESPFYW
jgi:hypothetical protein